VRKLCLICLETSRSLSNIVAQARKDIVSTNSVVRARIDERTKAEAAAVLSAIGLTVSDAFRLMMIRIAREKALPFEPLVPNAKTIQAMKAARRGEVVTVDSPAGLLASLRADR
jgi:DNA-damage-inducible protein J